MCINIQNAVAETIIFDNFENGWGDWYSERGIWDLGESKLVPERKEFTGNNCIGTVLDGNYPYGPDSRLIGPDIELPTIGKNEEIVLRFRQYYSYSSSDKGIVQIQVYDEETMQYDAKWIDVKTVYSYTPNWHHARIDLSEYSGKMIRVGFYHNDNTEKDWMDRNIHQESSGWYIDNFKIEVKTIEYFSEFETFESGWNNWYTDSGIWEVGSSDIAPEKNFDGQNCLGTILNNNYPYGPDSRLVSPPIKLPQKLDNTKILLRFWHYYCFASSDRGYIEIRVFENEKWAAKWIRKKELFSYLPSWHYERLDLTEYAGKIVQISFLHVDNTEKDWMGRNIHQESKGWYIDNIEIIPRTTLSAFPDSIDFGKISIGSKRTQSFDIFNKSDQQIFINEINISGTDQSEFSIENDAVCSNSSLLPSEKCSLKVNFLPKTEGDKTAYVKISMNNDASKLLKVPLQGIAVIQNDPEIKFSYVPPIGNMIKNLKGNVRGIGSDINQYKVAIYIFIENKWYSKPYDNNPLTTIRDDLTWECDITTKSNDHLASKIAGFLISSGYTPPVLSGTPILPEEIYTQSIAYTEVTRKPIPKIEFTYLPPKGSFDNLEGKVIYLDNCTEYGILVYIYVAGGWWTKPYWSRPVSKINADCTFTVDITTGGIDEKATRIKAFLVDKDYDPPLGRGQSHLPPIESVAEVETNR
jgi:hypothetical protein